MSNTDEETPRFDVTVPVFECMKKGPDGKMRGHIHMTSGYGEIKTDDGEAVGGLASTVGSPGLAVTVGDASYHVSGMDVWKAVFTESKGLAPFEKGAGPDEDSLAYHNGKYQIIIRKAKDGDGVEYFFLSLRREDRRAIFDWRDLQEVKNQFFGPEEEMVQLFPAESRLVDTANQFWFVVYPGRRWPFGFQQRLISETSSVTGNTGQKSQQRPFPEGRKPIDLLQQEEAMMATLADAGFDSGGEET